MTDDNNHVCSNPDCRVSETGKCVEGMPLEDCPTYGKKKEPLDLKSIEEDTETISDQEDLREEVVSLPAGEKLKTKTSEQLLKKNKCRVIALIGPTAVGKTTLIATLYDMLGQTTFSGLYFSRSETLIAFEKACHWARDVSRCQVPRTERTRLGAGLGFYHLGLLDHSKSNLLDLLLGDRSGEGYEEIGHNPSIVLEYPEINRADTINIMIDGRRLSDVGARHFLRSETELILQGLIDGNGVTSSPQLAVVLTKYDIIKVSSNKVQSDNDFELFVNKVNSLFSDYFCKIKHFKTAALPETDILPRGYGMDELLKYWLAPLPIKEFKKVFETERTLRAFERIA